MRVTKENLRKLETYYVGYLEGEKLEEFIRDFDVKIAAGHWAAGDFLDRFATRGYFPELKSDIISQLERVCKAGIKGVEFHDVLFLNEKGEIDEDKITEVKEFLKEHDIVATNMNMNLWTDPKWKMGGVTNVKKEIREQALQQALKAIEIAKKLGCGTVNLWPGSDGWDYNFEVNYGKQLEMFIEACITINKEAYKNGLKFCVEAKLHEPREGNMIIPTTHLAAFIAKEVNRECGVDNMGLCIDYGHEQMYASEPAQTVYALKVLGVPLLNIHSNTAKLHSNDEDRLAGTGDIWRYVDFLYATVDIGYEGWYGEDQFTYRMDPVKAMALSKELIANCLKKALLIYAHKDELEAIREKGDQAEVVNFVKKIILTG